MPAKPVMPAKPSIPVKPSPAPSIPAKPHTSTMTRKGQQFDMFNVAEPTPRPEEVATPERQFPPTPGTEDGSESIHEKRKKIVNEVLSTERYYCKCIENMVHHYMHPLLQLAESDVMPNRSKYEINSIFANIEQILPINRHLLEAVRQRIDNWHEGQLIGDIFLKMAPFFKMYNTYGNNYENSVEIISRCQMDTAFNDATDKIAEQIKSEWGDTKDGGPVSLESLLIMPVQRIPRYNLLLRDLLRKTDETHPDFANLTEALEQFENVMTYLDSNITEAENMKKFLEMGAKFKGGNRLIQAHRVLITEGVVALGKRREKAAKNKLLRDERLQIWLFNDVLVHLKTKKSKSKTDVASTEYTWPLQLIWIEDEPEEDLTDQRMPYAFYLIGPRKSYVLKFPTLAEKHQWMDAMKSAIKKVLNEDNAPDETRRLGSYKFPKEGGEYTGWWDKGRIHGEGMFKFFGNKYNGEWSYNTKCGIGTFDCVSGERYFGQWEDDRPNGFGTFTYANSDVYEGQWKDGMRDGKGELKFITGDEYDGEWKANVPCGEGTYRTITGYSYRGGWENGKFEGMGEMVCPNGRSYNGSWRNGKRDGIGKMNYANGEFYTGVWRNGKPTGFGLMQSIVDGVYEGWWENGLREGKGVMVFKNGNFYSGQWRRDKFHGRGTFVCMDGAVTRYDGHWEEGKFSGKGNLSFTHGGKYSGMFKEDKPHGSGVYTSYNSSIFEGKWQDGVRHGRAVLSIGPARWESTCKNGVMNSTKESRSVLVVPEMPCFHLHL
eukprot:TRINITY_DN1593_c0_g2_i1.p1 TRINITY_DN1593_c0_g2~~TRINITY_DN1593_c0_g2_i1.p1  ORF type:complete len:856 (+),score=264.35 TRINITY_DN1593_c0_g2_i1:254-2569(+)